MASIFVKTKIESTVIYNGKVYVKGDEVDIEVKKADSLVERNLVTVIGETPKQDEDKESSETVDELEQMTVDELKEYATEAGIDLKGKTLKADIIKAIREVM